MKLTIDESMRSIGITDVVYATAKGLDAHAIIPEALEDEIWQMGEDVVDGKYDDIYNNDVTEGYRELIKKAGRSVKKNPPTAPGFIDNIKHRGSMPRINSIVDVYNIESIRSSVASAATTWIQSKATSSSLSADRKTVSPPSEARKSMWSLRTLCIEMKRAYWLGWT